MTSILFDALLTLLWPTVQPTVRDSDKKVYVYTAIIDRYGLRIPVHIAHRISDPGSTPILPHGSNAQVLGNAHLVQKTFFVEAKSIWARDSVDEDVETRQARVSWSALDRSPDTAWPILVFAGTVSCAVRGVGQTVTVLDITVGHIENWVDGPATFRCSFDQSTTHLHDLRSLDIGVYIHLSGTLSGIDSGRLTVDVHDIRFAPHDYPCTGLGITRGLGTSPVVADRLCQWLQCILDKCGESEEETCRSLSAPDSAQASVSEAGSDDGVLGPPSAATESALETVGHSQLV